jgi:hypothetical protein
VKHQPKLSRFYDGKNSDRLELMQHVEARFDHRDERRRNGIVSRICDSVGDFADRLGAVLAPLPKDLDMPVVASHYRDFDTSKFPRKAPKPQPFHEFKKAS